MDKSYIIRIYQQENNTVKGIVEDIERNKRQKFSNAKQLWTLITGKTIEHSVSNVLYPAIFNTISSDRKFYK